MYKSIEPLQVNEWVLDLFVRGQVEMKKGIERCMLKLRLSSSAGMRTSTTRWTLA